MKDLIIIMIIKFDLRERDLITK